MHVQYSCMQAFRGLFGFTNLGVDLFVKPATAGDNASKVVEVFHCLQCYTPNTN